MSSGAPAQWLSPAASRHQAQLILAERRFHNTHLPRPLAGILHELGDLLGYAGHVVSPLLGPIGHLIANQVTGAILLAAVLGVMVATMSKLLRRRRSPVTRASPGGPLTAGPDVAGLEASAREAEDSGDVGGAYRLWFRAGLARLEAGGALTGTAFSTSRQLCSSLGLTSFDELSRRLEEIVFAGHPALPTDISLAHDRWQRVLQESLPRGTDRAARDR